MAVTAADVSRAAIAAGVAGRPVCLHAAPSGLGVEGGVAAVVVGLLGVDCTVMVPTFSEDSFAVSPPPPDARPRRNGLDYERLPVRDRRVAFDPSADDVDVAMGEAAAEVLAVPVRRRGRHPLWSFAAVGAQADQLVGGQSGAEVYAPLEALARLGGTVVLAGAGLSSMTLLHLAEVQAGRAPFVRAARVSGEGIVAVRVGGCGRGFENLRPALEAFESAMAVGPARWRVFDASSTLEAAAHAIRRDRRLTRCPAEECARCEDAIAGGPIGRVRLA